MEHPHLNVSAEAGCSTNSGSSTPSNLSQQNLIKIMRKIKTSSNAPINNKENVAVAPPNIIVGHQPQRPQCLDSLHPSGSTTPTDHSPMVMQSSNQNLLAKHIAASNYNSNQSTHSAHSLQSTSGVVGQKKIISMSKLQNLRTSKDVNTSQQSTANNTSSSTSVTHQNHKVINLQQAAHHQL